jgi:glycosyltransferase involved in cell wall biosynthesis
MPNRNKHVPRFDPEQARRGLPDAFLTTPPPHRRPRLVSTGGATRLAKSFSGSSLYLAKSGIRTGVLDGAFTLYDGRGVGSVKLKGAMWKALRLVRGQPVGAFKFTDIFQDSIWKKHLPLLAGCDIIHNTQLVGQYFIDNRRRFDVRSVFYIDGSLREYIDEYGNFELKENDPSIFERAIDIERKGYMDAELVVTMSKRAADVLVRSYGIPHGKIRVVPPGANLDDHIVADNARPMLSEFIVGAVGYYPERKGFARLIDAVRLLRRSGENISAHVVGNLPVGYTPGDGLVHYGPIDKATNMDRYYSIVRNFNVGCQLSYAEFVGIAILEYLRLGVPVIATRVGGTTDILKMGGSIGLPRDITSVDLAAELKALIRNPTRYSALKTEALALSDWASWMRAARSLDQMLGSAVGGQCKD